MRDGPRVAQLADLLHHAAHRAGGRRLHFRHGLRCSKSVCTSGKAGIQCCAVRVAYAACSTQREDPCAQFSRPGVDLAPGGQFPRPM